MISLRKPAEIEILETHDDILNGKIKVRYAFRFLIKQTTTTVPEPEGGEIEKPAWEYEEVISEMELPLIYKPALPEVLKALYNRVKDTMEQNLTLARTQLPKEINLDSAG